MNEILLSIVFIVWGYKRGNLNDAFIISFSVMLTSSVRFYEFDQYIYCTILIIIYTATLHFIKSYLIRWSQVILIIYSILGFSFSAYDALYQSDYAWSKILLMLDWYPLVYLCTMLLVIAGLANGDNSGGRKRINTDVRFINRSVSLHNRNLR